MRQLVVCLIALICAGSCRDTTQGVTTQFFGTYPFSATERRTIARIAGATAIEVRRHLPGLASQITLQVHTGKDVIPEVGAGATAIPPDWVRWTVDPDNPQGVLKISETHLRAALFHEFHHLVRGTMIDTLLDRVVMEGMATAFERDFAGASPPWGQYPDEVSTWVNELLNAPSDSFRTQWLSRHPDGRRWVGYRSGTYLVDLAMKQLNRSSAQLVSTPADEILAATPFKPAASRLP